MHGEHDCRAARRWMRDAEPEALASFDLSCSACRSAARRILAQRDLLAAVMEPPPAVEAAAAAASAIAEAGERRRRARERTFRLGIAGGLALAAAAAGVLLLPIDGTGPRRQPARDTGAQATTETGSGTAGEPAVVAGDEDVAVFATDDPDIVVVWFLAQGGGER